MNILAQIIPGIRETRTPLAIGALWTAVGWVLSSFIPKHFWQLAVLQAGTHQITKFPTEIIVAAAVFLVYIIGVILELVGNLILVVVRLILWIALIPLVLYAAWKALSHWQTWLIAAILFFGIPLLAALRRRRRVPGTSLPDAIDQTIEDFEEYLASRSQLFTSSLRKAIEPDYALFQELVKDELELLFSKKPEFLRNATVELDDYYLYETARSVGVTREELLERATPEQQSHILNVRSVADLRFRRDESPNLDSIVREVLTEHLEESAGAREIFAMQVLELEQLRGMLRKRLERAHVLLRAKQTELYNEYDRLRAEGEFRSGVSIPLAALLIAGVIRVAYDYSSQVSSEILTYACLSGATIGSIMYIAGSSKSKHATKTLYACIRNELIAAPREEAFNLNATIYRSAPPRIKRRSELIYELKETIRAVAYRSTVKSLAKIRRNIADKP